MNKLKEKSFETNNQKRIIKSSYLQQFEMFDTFKAVIVSTFKYS